MNKRKQIKLSDLFKDNDNIQYERIEINKNYCINKIEIIDTNYGKMLILNRKYNSYSKVLIQKFEKILKELEKEGIDEYELNIKVIQKQSQNGLRYYTIEDI